MATEDTRPVAKKTAQQSRATTGTTGKKKAAVRKKTSGRKRPAAKTTSPRKTVSAKPAAAPQDEAAARALRNVYTREQRHKMIATMAYFLAEKRGFTPGKSDEDWLNSEKIIDDLLKKQGITLSE